MEKKNGKKILKIKQKGGKNKIIIKGDYTPHFVVFDKKSVYSKNKKNLNKNLSLSPMSGSEPKYDEKKWNDIKIKSKHNCYAYATNQINTAFDKKPQPGYAARMGGVPNKEYSCMAFLKRLKKDLPSMYLVDFNSPCMKGFHKSFMAIDTKIDDPDYHFWRMDDDGLWSHKPGAGEVSKVDASGKKIMDPAKSNREWIGYQYKKPCFYFCVNPKLVSVKDSHTQ